MRSLYFRLSQNVHERVEYTDAGRAIEEGKEIFELHAPILAQSLSDFLADFHSVMEIGVIMILNVIASRMPQDQLQDKAKQFLDSEDFKLAELRKANRLLKSRSG